MSVTVDVPAGQTTPPTSRPSAARRQRLTSLRRFLPHLRPHRSTLITATVLSVVSMLTVVVTPLLVVRIVDGPIAHGDLRGALAPVGLVLLLGVIEAATLWARRWLLAGPATTFEKTMRAKLFAHLQALAIGRHDGWESGQLLSRAVDDLSTLRRFVNFAGPMLIVNVVLIPAGVLVLLTMSPLMAVVFLVEAVPLLIVCTRFERMYSLASRRSQDQTGDLATTAQESAQGIRVLKAFGRGAFFGRHFTTQARSLQGTELRKARLNATLWAAMRTFSELGVVAALGIGAYGVVQGTLSLGAVVGAISLLTFLMWPVAWIGFLLSELQNAATAADRYWEIVDTPLDIADPVVPAPLSTPVRGEVRFDDVRFAFPGSDSDLLRGVSLVLRPGETVALVGATGSGKTALLQLLPRLYDVTGGAVRIDGVDVRDLRLRDLRSVVAVAFEDPVLFSASVRENVALGDPGATDEQVRLALDIAQATDFVEALPWGLDTRIGEQGLSLSGGQRQRLALARAVLAHADGGDGGRVVVLDDPLSALDVETEERVQTRLRGALAGATTLLVAHRPSTAALADRVALLAGGRIVAEGTHEQLLRTENGYRELMGGQR